MEKEIRCQACGRLLINKAVVYRNHGYDDYYCTIDCLKRNVFTENVMLGKKNNLSFEDLNGQKQRIDLKFVSKVEINQRFELYQNHESFSIQFWNYDVILGNYKISFETMKNIIEKLNDFFEKM